MKKIALVVNGLGIGGLEKTVITYLEIFSSADYEVTVINLQPKEDRLLKTISEKADRVLSLNFDYRMSPYTYFYGIKKFSWGIFIVPIVFFLLYITNMIYSFLYKSFLFVKYGKLNYDLAISLFGQIPDLTFVKFNFITSKKKVAFANGSFANYVLVTEGFIRLYLSFDVLVVTSDVYKKEALYGSKFLDEKLKIIRLPIPWVFSEEINFDEVSRIKQTFGKFLLMVARFSKQKDQITLINAFKLLIEDGYSDWKLVFVGGGETLQDCKLLVDQYGLSSNVFFVGELEDPSHFYRASKVFIHSSPFEGGPATVLEAMHYGIPVVTSRSLPGVPELTDDGKYASIFEVGNHRECSLLIKELITDKELYQNMKKLGYERAKYYSVDNLRDEILNGLGV
jgi:glycosyltransferase involved in cell wall biosynthesis